MGIEKRGLSDILMEMVPTTLGFFYLIAFGIVMLLGLFVASAFTNHPASADLYFSLIVFLIISIITKYPERFRGFLSFKVGVGLTILVTIYGGFWYGLIFAIISVITEAISSTPTRNTTS